MISFIIPAYNEEALLPRTLRTLRASAGELGEPFEIVVVNDASADRTAAVAAAEGARVIDVNLRQIGAVRNAGARQAKGDVLIFVDADTLVPAGTLRSVQAALHAGAAGGGARVDFDQIPFVVRIASRIYVYFYHLLGFAGGCFMFARRDSFEAAGGFDEQYFISEEVHLSKALKRRGPFVLVRPPVLTSGRKGRMYRPLQLLWMALSILARGPAGFRRREGLDLWYDGKREGDAPPGATPPGSLPPSAAR